MNTCYKVVTVNDNEYRSYCPPYGSEIMYELDVLSKPIIKNSLLFVFLSLYDAEEFIDIEHTEERSCHDHAILQCEYEGKVEPIRRLCFATDQYILEKFWLNINETNNGFHAPKKSYGVKSLTPIKVVKLY